MRERERGGGDDEGFWILLIDWGFVQRSGKKDGDGDGDEDVEREE